MRAAVWGAVLALGCAGCQSPLSPAELRSLAAAEKRWAARGFGDYSVEIQISCFCPFELNGWSRIDVVGGSVIRATLLQSGAVIQDSRVTYWPTVEEIFHDIRTANSQEDLDDLELSFDRELGYPTSVRFISSPNLLDGGSTSTLRNARPYP